MKLFCLTFAGGTAAFYDRLEACLNPEISVIKLEYAGHGIRHRESFYGSFSELAEDMYRLILQELARGDASEQTAEPYALMGYSMGSISAAEVLKRIITCGKLPAPEQIFLAAHEPTSHTGLNDWEASDFDEAVKKHTIQFGGIPERLVHNKSFWRVYLPIYKADYRMIENYDFSQLKVDQPVPVTVFYSETDTPYSRMKDWSKHFAGRCDYVRYDGPHFFIQEHCEEIANDIKRRLLDRTR